MSSIYGSKPLLITNLGFPRVRGSKPQPDSSPETLMIGDGLAASWNQVVATRYTQLRMQSLLVCAEYKRQETTGNPADKPRSGWGAKSTVNESGIDTRVVRHRIHM